MARRKREAEEARKAAEKKAAKEAAERKEAHAKKEEKQRRAEANRKEARPGGANARPNRAAPKGGKGAKPGPPTPAMRVKAAFAKVHEFLGRADTQAAREELAVLYELKGKEPALEAAGLTTEAIEALRVTIDTMPAAAMQVLNHATRSPFSAIGIPRLAEMRLLNTVNKRNMLKNYRKLAMQLHPDKCDHAMAIPAMQALNGAYDKALGEPNKPKPPPKPKSHAYPNRPPPRPQPKRGR